MGQMSFRIDEAFEGISENQEIIRLTLNRSAEYECHCVQPGSPENPIKVPESEDEEEEDEDQVDRSQSSSGSRTDCPILGIFLRQRERGSGSGGDSISYCQGLREVSEPPSSG